ncbi:MAG: adenylosuccinate lyase [Pirellulaceae bacterium]
MDETRYQNPLITRYASPQMAALFGSQKKFSTWRRLWLALAEAQQSLGLDISDEQLAEMRSHLEDINWEVAARYEGELRHDVMAHVHTFADACPNAGPVIHLGATSCFVTDNADLIIFREALGLVAARLAEIIGKLGKFALENRDVACLGFTHLQPAQPTTIGKRATLWAYDLILDLADLEYRLTALRARGVKGTTGTQASFLKLFENDHDKVTRLDELVAEKIGFDRTWAVTGQTYPRKIDVQIMDVLSAIAQSAHKMATDLRILAHRKEIEEPFEARQIGSSAMPYKRNPMRSERICALARFVISLQSSPANTLATQWLERTLDDSANRRLVLPQAFLAVDAVLILLSNITDGMVVYEKVIGKNLAEELPFMATENILMAAVEAGGNRQELHERIRQHSVEAGRAIKQQGQPNDLLQRLKDDPAFAAVNLEQLLSAGGFVGRAPEQVDEFCETRIRPIVERYRESGPSQVELTV